MRAEHIFTATAASSPEGGTRLSFSEHEIDIPGKHGGEVRFVVRPENVRVLPAGTGGVNTMPATLVDAADRGAYRRLELDAGRLGKLGAGVPVVAFVAAGADVPDLAPGSKHALAFPPEAVHVLQE